MARVLPEWQPFELETENPTPLELPGRRGPGVVLLVSPSIHESGWGARAAAQIAGLRAVRSRRILLGDLAVENPHLHELLEVENDVGMSDVFLFGTSIQKTARKADGGFLFSPAGTAVADPGRILEHERWADVLEGFERAGADLFLYVPWSSAGWQSLVATVGNVVVLAGRHEVAALDIPDGGEVRIGAVLGPPDRNGGGDAVVTSAEAVTPAGGPHGEAAEDGGEATSEDDGVPGGVAEAPDPADPHVREAETSGSVELPDDAAEERMTEAVAPEPPGGPEPRLHEPDPGAADAAATGETAKAEAAWPVDEPREEERTSESSSGRLWLAIVVVLVVVAVALAVAVAVLRGPDDASGSPGEPSAPASVGEGSGTDAAPRPSEEVETGGVTGPADQLHPFVVRVASYREAEAAEEARASLAARLDGTAVLRVPVAVDGVVWHRIVAGPASDVAGARALRVRASGLLGVDTTSMLVRSAPFSFQIDAGPALADMSTRAEALRADGIPAYVLESAGAGGTSEFRVYAGAFESPDDASHLRSVLAEAGLPDAALVERMGRLPGA